MDRKMLLQKPSEQSRLLHEVPEVIADVLEAELTFEDSSRKDKQGCLPELAPGTTELPSTDLKGKGTSCYTNGGKYPAGSLSFDFYDKKLCACIIKTCICLCELCTSVYSCGFCRLIFV